MRAKYVLGQVVQSYLMSLWNYDIFLVKMSFLMSILTYLRGYLYVLLALNNFSFRNHLKKLDVVIVKLLKTGLRGSEK